MVENVSAHINCTLTRVHRRKVKPKNPNGALKHSVDLGRHGLVNLILRAAAGRRRD
jgi:hypothetical protein